MTEDNYILNQQLVADTGKVERLRKQFVLIDNDSRNWTETYVDSKTGYKWLYYHVDTELQGNGYGILGLLPLPDKEQLIKLSLFSESEDEVFAACRTLIDNEKIQKIDFRLDLINALESLSDKKRQETVIRLTGLDNALNRREVLGKTFEQIDRDADYFKRIADRADKIKQRTNAQQ